MRVLQRSLVQFLPRLLILKYHVLSTKYFVDYFIYTNVKENFLFLLYIPSLIVVLSQPAAERKTLVEKILAHVTITKNLKWVNPPTLILNFVL